MEIAKITLRQIRMPLLRPFTTSFGTMLEKEFILVEVTDRSGISGWGESVAFVEPFYNEETLQGNWHIIKDFLIPMLQKTKIGHPSDLPGLFQRIRGNNMAKASLEMACWDLLAKQKGISLANAIGGAKSFIEVGVSIGIKKSPEELLDAIEEYLHIGYKRIKIKIMPGWDIPIVAKVREHFPEIKLMVDANSAYTLFDIQHLQQLDAFDLMMIEQPLAHDDLIDHSVLQKQMKTPICLDESIHSVEDARKAIQLGSGKIINIKAGRVGGLTESILLHDYCLEHHIPVWCGGMLESGVGRAHNIALSCLPNFSMPGDTAGSANYWEEDIIDPMVIVENGRIRVPEEVGIGYRLNPERIRRKTEYQEQYLID